MKMNPWVKRKWVKALRSGEYAQAQGTLYDDNDKGEIIVHCCLAVLLAEMRPEAFKVVRLDGIQRVVVNDEDADAIIADDLAIHWGLDNDTQNELAEMNDDGNDFLRIANYIEAEL